jgi:hypothetical protein
MTCSLMLSKNCVIRHLPHLVIVVVGGFDIGDSEDKGEQLVLEVDCSQLLVVHLLKASDHINGVHAMGPHLSWLDRIIVGHRNCSDRRNGSWLSSCWGSCGMQGHN